MSKPALSRRQARWVELLAPYNFTIEHKAGTSNLADGLSRRPDLLGALNAFQLEARIADRLGDAYWGDEWFMEAANREGLERRAGLWYLSGTDEIVVPADVELKRDIMRELHDCSMAAHRGVEKTLGKVRRLFWWPALLHDVSDYVRSCPDCERNKASTAKPAGLLQPLPVPKAPWQHVSLDLIVQLPRAASGNDALFVVVDRLTKMAHFIPTTSDAGAEELAQLFVRDVVRLHGVPEFIVGDRDRRWLGLSGAHCLSAWEPGCISPLPTIPRRMGRPSA